MVARDLILAELTGCRYHVAHISSQNSVAMVRYAKSRGLRVTAEATPHHFVLADTDMQPYDSNYKMKPPLRQNQDVRGVLEGLVDGTVDAVATDHAPHAGAEKMQEFERCPFGIIGLETALGLALEQLYRPGHLDLPSLVALFTHKPAAVLSLPGGNLRVGSPGDVTIFSTDHEWTYDVNRSPSKSRNTPFGGRRFQGGPLATFVGGKLVWQSDLL
jgi:dihydroorotase